MLFTQSGRRYERRIWERSEGRRENSKCFFENILSNSKNLLEKMYFQPLETFTLKPFLKQEIKNGFILIMTTNTD